MLKRPHFCVVSFYNDGNEQVFGYLKTEWKAQTFYKDESLVSFQFHEWKLFKWTHYAIESVELSIQSYHSSISSKCFQTGWSLINLDWRAFHWGVIIHIWYTYSNTHIQKHVRIEWFQKGFPYSKYIHCTETNLQFKKNKSTEQWIVRGNRAETEVEYGVECNIIISSIKVWAMHILRITIKSLLNESLNLVR